jgi:paraquat-inducible protein A
VKRRIGGNGLAAVLAVAALVVLVLGVNVPFISMAQLGRERVFSLLGGVIELFRRDHVLLGVVLGVFSIVFPFAKLLAILMATSRLVPISQRLRRGLHKAAALTGKYSLLDILVVAVMIVVVKFDGLAEVAARPGTAWFCGAILLSIAAGMCVRLEPANPEPT